MIVQPAEIGERATYKLLIGSVIPRPIAWISTQDRRGIGNLAPFSFFSIVSCWPPLLAVTMTPGDRGVKDTLRNIRSTHEYVVNIAP